MGEEPFFGSSPIRGCTAKSPARARLDAAASEARADTASPAPRTPWQPLNGRFFEPLRPQRPDPDKLSSRCNKNIISCADPKQARCAPPPEPTCTRPSSAPPPPPCPRCCSSPLATRRPTRRRPPQPPPRGKTHLPN